VLLESDVVYVLDAKSHILKEAFNTEPVFSLAYIVALSFNEKSSK